MSDPEIRFDDGAAYEHLMGRWSALVGERFLDWVAVPPHSRWVDVGCGNGAFTAQIVGRCQPSQVSAFDPAPAQLAFARTRLPSDAPVRWAEGDAMHLPIADASADAATMALVLFFVPDPARGVAEMCRVVRPGGTVAAYHWDILSGGFPLEPIFAELRARGTPPRMPPSVEASLLPASVALWEKAGLQQVRSCRFTVQRSFESFDDYWRSAMASNTLRPLLETMPANERAVLEARVRERAQAGQAGHGPLTLSATANAVCGIKP